MFVYLLKGNRLEFWVVGSQLQGRHEAVPLSPFLNPLNLSHVRGACKGAGALHAFYFKKFLQILTSKFSGKW